MVSKMDINGGKAFGERGARRYPKHNCRNGSRNLTRLAHAGIFLVDRERGTGVKVYRRATATPSPAGRQEEKQSHREQEARGEKRRKTRQRKMQEERESKKKRRQC
jgi:hypothetical protein